MSPNVKAFLDMLAVSELTRPLIAASDNGYNVLFGSTVAKPKLFDSYADHPRVRTYETHDEFIHNGRRDYTTAAGRYQITASTFDAYKARLHLSDFSPASQDGIAVQLIRERKAIPMIESGDLNAAILLVSPIWASLPCAGYGQHENTFMALRAAYLQAGGVLTAACAA